MDAGVCSRKDGQYITIPEADLADQTYYTNLNVQDSEANMPGHEEAGSASIPICWVPEVDLVPQASKVNEDCLSWYIDSLEATIHSVYHDGSCHTIA